jgi:hypothetical protein
LALSLSLSVSASTFFNLVNGGVSVPAVTWSSTDKDPLIVLSNGDRTMSAGASVNVSVFSSSTASTGKKYVELLMVTTNLVGIGYPRLGAANTPDFNTYLDAITQSISISPYGGVVGASGVTNNGHTLGAIAAGQVLMLAFDFDAGLAWVGLDGVWANSGNPATGANPSYSGLTGTWRVGASVAGTTYGPADQVTLQGSSPT